MASHRSRLVLVSVAIAAGIAGAVFATLYFTKDSGEEAAAPARCEDRFFGRISMLTPKDGTYELRFDPAWMTTGVTASVAAAEDGVVQPGEPVPNDFYEIDEGHRLLTYVVPENVPVTVLAWVDPESWRPTPSSVAELAQLVNGEKPVELFEPLDTGVWMRVDGDTVCTLDQAYRP